MDTTPFGRGQDMSAPRRFIAHRRGPHKGRCSSPPRCRDLPSGLCSYRPRCRGRGPRHDRRRLGERDNGLSSAEGSRPWPELLGRRMLESCRLTKGATP